jgi:tRNA-Thr(GGU) m(6)t(6)A37 methyltransferase TsaA
LKSTTGNNEIDNQNGSSPSTTDANANANANTNTNTKSNNNTNRNTNNTSDSDSDNIESITMKPIGKISSVYRLCVGTPRQGLLAPNSRGRIDLYPDQMSSDSILDLDKFSHIWVVFIFHLNSTSSKKRQNKQFPSKISPPALGGKKVGVFATRTPHRPNPVGFSLCKIDKVVIPKKMKHKKAKDQPYSVYVSGLDLVDGTPVLDIKPYVPHYDSVGYVPDNQKNNDNSIGIDDDDDDDDDDDEHNINDNDNESENSVRLPQWVSDGLDKRRPVSFTPSANKQLNTIMTNEDTANEMEFYGVASGRDASNEDGLQRIKSCIEEVLSVDVRSSFQTKKARKGKFQAERAIRVSDILSTDKTNKSQNVSQSQNEKEQQPQQ